MEKDKQDNKILPEHKFTASQKEREVVGHVYSEFFKYRSSRSGAIRQLDNLSFEEYLRQSRELFWNSIDNVPSKDLSDLGLELKIPFVRKELMDFVSRLVSLGIVPKLQGDELNSYGAKVLDGIYRRWRFKSNDKVEKFWDVLYGAMNGTTCKYVGYNGREKDVRYLTSYDPETGAYTFENKKLKSYDDVESCRVPIEDIYLSKMWEHNIQKQGRLIWKRELSRSEFDEEFGMYPDSKFVVAGAYISEQSLYFEMLQSAGVTTIDKIQVLKYFDTDKDEYVIVANGVWLNKIGKGEDVIIMPNPFHHKSMPFTWSLHEAIDDKFAYGLSLAFKEKHPHKMLNASIIMQFERELRAINAPLLSSDIETPDLVYKTGKITKVGDINQYKELDVKEPSQAFFTSLNSLQQWMTSSAQGGSTQIVPSVQPKSAKEISEMDKMRQQAMGCAVLMYYDLLRQEIMLMLKTAIQYYAPKHWAGSAKDMVRAITIPNTPLMGGGVGNMRIEVVKDAEGLKTPFENKLRSVIDSIRNGKKTEIIQITIDAIHQLEWIIQNIELKSESTSDIEKAMFQETAGFLMQFVQAGLIDPSKLILTYLEKNSIHPSDVMPDNVLPQAYSTWGGLRGNPMGIEEAAKGQSRQGMTGQFQQSAIGQLNGGRSNGGAGAIPNAEM